MILFAHAYILAQVVKRNNKKNLAVSQVLVVIGHRPRKF